MPLAPPASGVPDDNIVPWHHRCLLFDRVSSHVTWAVLGQAWPILALGAFLVTIGCAFGYVASRVAPLPGDLRKAAIAATAFANSQALPLLYP